MKNYNKLNRIKELKALRDVDSFAREVAKMARQINQRFYRLEKKGITNTTAYRYGQRDTHKIKPRYQTNINKLTKMELQELYELAIEINQKIVSPTSTLRGLKKIENKRINEAMKALGDNGIEVNREEFIYFINSGGGEILKNKYSDSEQILESWQKSLKQGVTTTEFIDIYNEMNDKLVDDVPLDLLAFNRKVKGIALRKRLRRLRRKKTKKK